MTVNRVCQRKLTNRAYLKVALKTVRIAILVAPTLVLAACDLRHRPVVYQNAAIGLSLSYPGTWKQLSNTNVRQNLQRDRQRADLIDSVRGSGTAQWLVEFLADPNAAYFVKPGPGDDVDAPGTMIIGALVPEIPIDEVTKGDLRLFLAEGLRGPAEWGVLPLARHPDLVNACENYEFRGTLKVQCRWVYVGPPFVVLLQITVAQDHIDDMRSIARTVTIWGMRPLANSSL